MKKLLLSSLIAISFISCQKEENTTPSINSIANPSDNYEMDKASPRNTVLGSYNFRGTVRNSDGTSLNYLNTNAITIGRQYDKMYIAFDGVLLLASISNNYNITIRQQGTTTNNYFGSGRYTINNGVMELTIIRTAGNVTSFINLTGAR